MVLVDWQIYYQRYMPQSNSIFDSPFLLKALCTACTYWDLPLSRLRYRLPMVYTIHFPLYGMHLHVLHLEVDYSYV